MRATLEGSNTSIIGWDLARGYLKNLWFVGVSDHDDPAANQLSL